MKKYLLGSALAVCFAMPAFVLAQAAEPTAAQPTAAVGVEEAAPNTGALHFGADLNFTTSYFFRGYNQEDTGLIFQPNVYGFTDIVDSDNFDLRAKVGLWNSLHSEQTASDGIWYESDLYGSLTATFNDTYYATLLYTLYTYPDDAFEEIHELGLAVGIGNLTNYWDKSDDKSFTMPLEIGVYKELKDQNGENDTYAEIKVTPTFAFGDEFVPSFGKPTLSIPVVLGGSLDGYYVDSDGSNETFGYASVGAALSLPMNFMPTKYGAWNLVGGVNYIHLFADSAELANDGGEDYEIQGTIGVSFTY